MAYDPRKISDILSSQIIVTGLAIVTDTLEKIPNFYNDYPYNPFKGDPQPSRQGFNFKKTKKRRQK